MCSQIRSGYNFQNVAVNYRYGSEVSEPISGFSEPINQKLINFTLLGKSNPGVDLGATRVVAEPLFEEFDEIQTTDPDFFDNTNPDVSTIQTTKILRLTGLNVINIGDGYTASNPIELTFSDLSNPLISGGQGQIFEQPILDITTIENGGLGGFSITSSGRFEGSQVVQGFSGTTILFTRAGTGFFPNQLGNTFDYNTRVYSGTGTLIYNETFDGVTSGPITGTGSFTGIVADVSGVDVFNGTFDQTSPTAQSIDIAFDTDDDDEFTFTETGAIFNPSTLIFTDSGIEPIYTVSASDPPNIQDQDDIRNGTNYSNCNNLTEDPIDRQAYTHVIRNPNVSSVSAILDIKALSDTQHKADQQYNITEKPGLFGGDLKVDFAFRIGNPIDSFVTIKFEYGFLGTDEKSVVQTTYNGQTIGGYLVESSDFSFASWKTLQQSDAKYSDLTIEQLKSSFPKYIRVSKDMFETTSSLIIRNVMLDSINEKFNTEYNYPSSAIVATKINSTYFDTIPTRTYDAKLKKVWVPETYNIEHFIEDKRFRTENEVPYDPSKELYYDPTRVFNKFSRKFRFGYNTRFGDLIAINGKKLLISDPRWGFANGFYVDYADHGNIFVYDNLGKGVDHSSDNYEFKMIRDGVPRSGPDLSVITRGPSSSRSEFHGVFDTVTNGVINSTNTNAVQSEGVDVLATTTTAILTFIDIRRLVSSRPQSVTHKLFLRISPKKSAMLRADVTTVGIPSNVLTQQSADLAYNDMVNAAHAVVIGTVSDPDAEVPDQIIKIVNSSGNRVQLSRYEETLITNPSETDYIYVKFFSAQTRQIFTRLISTPYGVINYAFLGEGNIAPLYSQGAVHPNKIFFTNFSLVDVSMQNFYNMQEPLCSESQGDYIVHSFAQNPVGINFDGTPYDYSGYSRYGLLIFKLDVNGFWYPIQFLSDQTDLLGLGYAGLEALSVSFFPGENRFAVIWEETVNSNPAKTKIYKLDPELGTFLLEDEIVEFTDGIFKGFEIFSSNPGTVAYCRAVNENTVIVTRSIRIRETQATRYQLRRQDIYDGIFVYKKNQTGWVLDDLIIHPEYRFRLPQSTGTPIDTHKDYLIAHGREYDVAPYKQTDIGVVYLYRYNGKKYEFIKKFNSDTIRNLNADGIPDDSNFDAYFGDYAAISCDENNEPVIIATASREEISGEERGYVYIFRKKPNSDEWISSKMNTFVADGYKIIVTSSEELNYGYTRLVFNGTDVAFQLVNFVSQTLVDSVGVFSLYPPEKSTRLLAGNDWFGMMKRGWSDNPVWIIYDLLTNPIYGAGAVLDDLKDINIFNFFEVSKYFDSASVAGYYIPIYDERGRTEPRLSCNFLLDSDFNAFDVISSICDMFFGALYIKEGKYNIWADRPTETSWYFNNHDVLDGNFSYSDTSKSKRASLIRVPFLDKYDGFKEKVEFIEDSELMRKNGKNEVKLDFVTFTTRSQARRFGKHYLYNQSYETEKVKFLTDSKALFLNPGDVIGVNDKLKSFKNEKLFYEVEDVSHIEKVYAVTHSRKGRLTSAGDETETAKTNEFTFSEITFKNSDTENFDVKYIDKENSARTNSLRYFDVALDNNKLPYVFTSDRDGNCAVYKKNGDDFDEVTFQEGVNYNFADDFIGNLAFDSSNNPYFSIIDGNTTASRAFGFCKLTGNDFTNTGDWKFTQIQNVDDSGDNFRAQAFMKSIIRINSDNEKFIFTYRYDSSPRTGEYLLFHNNGIDDDTNSGNWNRYVIDSHDSNQLYAGFRMQLTNNGKPAVAFQRSVEGENFHSYIKYKEFVGSSLGNQADWSEVFVQGGGAKNSSTRDNFDLKFDKFGIPYITHSWENLEEGNYILSPLSYGGRFNYDNWSANSRFIRYQTEIEDQMILQIMQNGSVMIFSADYTLDNEVNVGQNRSTSIDPKHSLQFEEAFDTGDWGKYHNWNKQSVYKTNVNQTNEHGYTPAIAYDFQGSVITLKNADAFLYSDVFSIDTSIKNNLELTKLFAGDISGLYNETQFQNFSSKIREQADIGGNYLTITGFETSGVFINLFPEESEANAKVIKELAVTNPMVRPTTVTEDLYKEYRILNILEKEPNLYEIEAKEYFSDKFNAIDTYASIVEPEQAEYNIGLPDNEVIRPPEPLGFEFVTGLDDAGSPFLTGLITGEPNGSETEYRLSLLYPNGRIVQKEIEKDTLNLSSSNEFLTDFGFYNLAVFGDYELDITSLRNPESSVSVDKKFTISELKEKLSVYPFIDDIDLLVSEDLLKIEIGSKNVYGEKLNLYDSNCRINLIIEGETYVENSKMTDFEISFQQIKDLTNSNFREKEIKAELTYKESVISEKSKILKDEAPIINNINFVSDGSSANIVAEILESEKLISVDMKTGETTIKTFGIQNQNKLQNFILQDFEVWPLPKNTKIDFTFTPKDFYGTGQSYSCEGYIPEEETVFEKYNNSIIPIYSIYSEDIISTGFSHYESSNNQSGFYGNGKDCLVEFSSSLLSGQSASLNLELVSDTESSLVSIKFEDEGYLSSKKVVNLSSKYHDVRVSGESGLFGGFDLKVKKLV